jgi:predicted CoA-binding protein
MAATLVIGVSENPERYAYKAVKMLQAHGHEVIAYGNRPGNLDHVVIHTEWDANWRPDTVTLYINPIIQEQFIDRILELHPRRVIFNPGTENPPLEKLLVSNSIEVEEACTLVMLSTGQY